MNITLRYFAVVREAMGRSSESRDIADGATAGDLLDLLAAEVPRIDGMRRSMMLMVNQEYVPPDHALRDGDEVVLIPPVSGGAGDAGSGLLFRVTADPLDPRDVEAAVADPATGATVTFTGTVRDHARGRAVSALEYEAYAPAAEKMLARIGDEIRERWGLERVAIVHRVGLLRPGEASVVIAVASAHRDEAFDACRHAIERLKEIVPIWKKEFYADGATWIGSEADYQRETGRLFLVDKELRNVVPFELSRHPPHPQERNPSSGRHPRQAAPRRRDRDQRDAGPPAAAGDRRRRHRADRQHPARAPRPVRARYPGARCWARSSRSRPASRSRTGSACR